jgi:hypothetical protein
MRAFGLMDMPRRMTVLFRDVEKKRRSHSRAVVKEPFQQTRKQTTFSTTLWVADVWKAKVRESRAHFHLRIKISSRISTRHTYPDVLHCTVTLRVAEVFDLMIYISR